MTDNLPQPQSDILIYQTEDGRTRIDVRLEDETVWLSQAALAELYQTTKQNISLHIRNILQEGELDDGPVVKEYLTTAADAKSYRVKHYNLDMILSVGVPGPVPSGRPVPPVGNRTATGIPCQRLCHE